MVLRRSLPLVSGSKGKKMLKYLSDKLFQTKVLNAWTLVDYRALNTVQKNTYWSILVEAMKTATPNILCGGSETEHIALAIQNEMESGLDDPAAFLDTYRAESNLRTTDNDFNGVGHIRFALFNNTDLIGSVVITQASILNKQGGVVSVRITPLLHRQGVRVFNRARTAITAAWTSDQATLIRYVLNNDFPVEDSSIVARPVLVNPHPRNGRLENWQAIVNYDAALATIMATFNEITTETAFEGARPYKLYKHV